MKIIIDVDRKLLIEDGDGALKSHDLYSRESFELISRYWVKVGWSMKYPYTFSWLGRPIIQLPEDMMRIQEVIFKIQPDVIIETGIAHGGSLIFYATLCKVNGKGRVIGIDIEIRPHNRSAIETHPLFPYITLIEGSSTDRVIVDRVKSMVKGDEVALIILDSNHSKQHVLEELEAYHQLVAPGSYIVVTDGIMGDLYDVPRGSEEWRWDNPTEAAREFQHSHPEFVFEQPAWAFNESVLQQNVTHWPEAWLRRR
jgi:cephalosporin hydroxylase